MDKSIGMIQYFWNILQNVLPIWILVKLRMLNFNDCTRTVYFFMIGLTCLFYTVSLVPLPLYSHKEWGITGEGETENRNERRRTRSQEREKENERTGTREGEPEGWEKELAVYSLGKGERKKWLPEKKGEWKKNTSRQNVFNFFFTADFFLSSPGKEIWMDVKLIEIDLEVVRQCLTTSTYCLTTTNTQTGSCYTVSDNFLLLSDNFQPSI